jgi:23S rRNA (uracil1939-C5)-methyltransferase
MSRKKKDFPLLKQVTIADAGSEGKAVGRVDDQVVFVPFVVPGDVVDIKVHKKRKSYMEGRVVKIHQYSDKRMDPRCEHFGVCGGCKWQNMAYEHQLFYKQKQVTDNLIRIGKVDLPKINPILPSEEIYYYRNKLEFTFSNKRWLTDYSKEVNFDDRNMNALGFHIPGMFDRVLDLNNCYLQAEPSNSIRLAVKNFADINNLDFYDVKSNTGFLRNLLIRNTTSGELLVILVFHFDDHEKIGQVMEFIKKQFQQITCLGYVINPKLNDSITDLEFQLFNGQSYITEEMNGLKFRISPLSFFQTNTRQALKLYQTALDFAGLKGGEVVYDLYSGTGTIACFFARQASRVVGIEYVEDAVSDARINAKINDIGNTIFYAGDIASLLNEDFVKTNGQPDVIVTDPPRAGMHEKVVKQILQIAPEKIVYVSCNPATQARDINLLGENYKVEKIQPVDMFPHTHHVENVVLLRRK